MDEIKDYAASKYIFKKCTYSLLSLQTSQSRENRTSLDWESDMKVPIRTLCFVGYQLTLTLGVLKR